MYREREREQENEYRQNTVEISNEFMPRVFQKMQRKYQIQVLAMQTINYRAATNLTRLNNMATLFKVNLNLI